MQQRLAGVLVDHRRNLDRLPIDGGVELKSNAHTTFGASATTSGGAEDVPARLRGEWTRRCSPSSRQSRCTFFTLIWRPSSWRSAAQARRFPGTGV